MGLQYTFSPATLTRRTIIGGVICGVIYGLVYVASSLFLKGGSEPGLLGLFVGIGGALILIVGSLPWSLIPNIPQEIIGWAIVGNGMLAGLVSGAISGLHKKDVGGANAD